MGNVSIEGADVNWTKGLKTITVDVRAPTLTIICQPCGRRGRYNVARLIKRFGDAKILFVLPAIANCPKARSADIYDLCKARYEGLTTRTR